MALSFFRWHVQISDGTYDFKGQKLKSPWHVQKSGPKNDQSAMARIKGRKQGKKFE